MPTRYRNPPVKPSRIVVDGAPARLGQAWPRPTWIREDRLQAFATWLCRRGRVHLVPEGTDRTRCGKVVAEGWARAAGFWCSTTVVRCQSCERIARQMQPQPTTGER